MYSIFSAWKFYSKERVLLKKYLFECGESITDMSLMSTVEMRNTAAKVNTERKIYSEAQVPTLKNSAVTRNKSRDRYQPPNSY